MTADPRFVAIPLGQSQRFHGATWTYDDSVEREIHRCPHAHRKPESAITCAREWFLREGK